MLENVRLDHFNMNNLSLTNNFKTRNIVLTSWLPMSSNFTDFKNYLLSYVH